MRMLPAPVSYTHLDVYKRQHPGYVKPKHEFNYQQAVERLPGEDPSQLNDPAYRRLRLITDNLKQEELSLIHI